MQKRLFSWFRTILGFTTCWLFFFTSQAMTFSVAVNSKSGVSSLSGQQIKNIYLGEQTFWENGKRIHAARLSDEDPLTLDFIKTALSLSLAEFLQNWRHKLFSGRALPPKKVESTAGMIAYLEHTEGAIGYLPKDSKAHSENVVIIQIK